MKFFRRLHKDVDVKPLLAEIDTQQDAWLANTNRQDKIFVQRHTNTIFLRGAAARSDLHVNENQESVATKMSGRFPLAINFLAKVADDLKCSLSRATIVRLKPQSHVGVHIDVGSYYLIRDRYHLVLQSRSGSVLQSGNEQIRMREGELWWFDNKQHHSSLNESEEWRIHYVFDLLPAAYEKLATNPVPLELLRRNAASTQANQLPPTNS